MPSARAGLALISRGLNVIAVGGYSDNSDDSRTFFKDILEWGARLSEGSTAVEGKILSKLFWVAGHSFDEEDTSAEGHLSKGCTLQ